MGGTMTVAGFDVHARSIDGAAVHVPTGELLRIRFGCGVEGPIEWLRSLPGPVRACYEAGPTGFGLYRAAVAAGFDMQVVAPGKTPRGRADRVKTDRKDAELLARLLLAGSLSAITVPSPQVEAARELVRTHDAIRRDLMTARHRVSKQLLRHGRVYPRPSTWTVAHRTWLSRQQFDELASELAFADAMAGVDGLTARKTQVAERLSRLATDEQWWPTVARLRCFRGIDTLTALPARPGARVVARVDAVAVAVRGVRAQRVDHQDRFHAGTPALGRGGLALHPRAADRRDAAQPPGRPARPHPADRQSRPAATAPRPQADARPRQAGQRHRRGLRA